MSSSTASHLTNIVPRGVTAPAIMYLLDGRQHVAILAGGALFDFALSAD